MTGRVSVGVTVGVLAVAAAACTDSASQDGGGAAPAGAGAAAAAAAGVTASIGFRALPVTTETEIPPPGLGVDVVTDVTVAPDGRIVLVDARAGRFSVLTADGALLGSFGRVGTGPGEFQRIGPVGWLGDTLVAVDTRVRRMTLLRMPAGEVLGVVHLPAAVGYPWRFVGASQSLALATTRGHGEPDLVSSLGVLAQRQSRHFFRARASGLGDELRTYTQPPAQPDFLEPICADRGGSVHTDLGPFPDLGPLDGLTSDGSLVEVARDSLVLAIRSPVAGVPATVVRVERPAVPVDDATWDSVSRPYRDIARDHGPVQCDPEYARPAFVPAGRMLRVDEADHIWVEVTERAGTSIHIIARDGTPVGVFATPSRDESVPWFVRGNRLHIVRADADGQQRVVVYRVGAAY